MSSMAKMKARKGWLILEGIQHFGAAIFILCLGLCLSGSGIKPLIFAECAIILFRSIHYFYFSNILSVKYRIGSFFRSVTPCAVAIIIAAALGFFVKNSDYTRIINFVEKIVAVVLIYPIVVPMFSDDKDNDRFVIRYRELTSLQKILYKLFSIFYRIFVIAGLLLTIVAKPFLGLYFEGVTITGCVLWCCLESLKLYCAWNCEIVSDGTNQEQEYDDSETEEISYQSGSDSGERELNQHDVYLKVKKIADKWSYREEPVSLMTQGKIRYNVSVEVTGFDRINYTINGKLSGVSDASEAQTYAQSKINNAAYNIKYETERELANCNLPHSYEINVDIGYIE